MKVLVLKGSPHPAGTTACLSDAFCAGAREAGHQVQCFDTAQLTIQPCTGCDYCRKNDGACIFEDDMLQINPHLLDADVVVLATPLYYFGMTAQLKSVIDRFYAINAALRARPKQLLLLAAGSEEGTWAMEGLKAHIKALCRYLGWEEGGQVLALEAGTAEDVKGSQHAVRAEELGRTL